MHAKCCFPLKSESESEIPCWVSERRSLGMEIPSSTPIYPGGSFALFPFCVGSHLHQVWADPGGEGPPLNLKEPSSLKLMSATATWWSYFPCSALHFFRVYELLQNLAGLNPGYADLLDDLIHEFLLMCGVANFK